MYGDDPRLAPLIGPGGPFETEEVVVGGVTVRSFVKAPRSIVDAFRAARRHADLVHVVLDDERLTFADVQARALGLARHLRDSFGVRGGDRVVIAMRNYPEFYVSFWATALVGAVVVPLNAWGSGAELDYGVEDAGAAVVFADEERIDRLGSAPGRTVVSVRACRRGTVPIEELTPGTPLDDSSFADPEPDDPMAILYTSGTTGRPKGAVITHRNMFANLINMAFMAARETAITGRHPAAAVQSASLASAPLFHIGGISGIVGSSMSGSKVVLMHKWDLEVGLELARREGVTAIGGIPAIARQVLDRPGVENLGLDIRSVPLGGAAVAPDLPRRALETFGPEVQIFNGYGSTETTSAVVQNVGSEYAAHLESVGRPNLTADLRVEGPEGQEVPSGAVGELCFRSPQVVQGYWNRPDDTAAAFAGGWFHTGDLGYVDADGFVYVVDRIKDVVIRGGENVYCAEVEAVLCEAPGVAEVTVVGVPEERLGERVCAVVVERPGTAITLEGLRAHARVHLAAFKCPEALYRVGELPRTPTGKTAKLELRAVLASDVGAVDRLW